MLPYYYNIENSKFLIHDNLDSNVVWFKNLAESGELFNHSGGVIERTLNGLSRKFYPSDLNIHTITYYLFPPIKAYCILKIFNHVIALLGMYLLAGFLLRKKQNKKLISALVALMFSLIPFWPSGGLTVAGQPLLLYSFLNLINKKKFNFIMEYYFLFPVLFLTSSWKYFFYDYRFFNLYIVLFKKEKILSKRNFSLSDFHHFFCGNRTSYSL